MLKQARHRATEKLGPVETETAIINVPPVDIEQLSAVPAAARLSRAVARHRGRAGPDVRLGSHLMQPSIKRALERALVTKSNSVFQRAPFRDTLYR